MGKGIWADQNCDLGVIRSSYNSRREEHLVGVNNKLYHGGRMA